MDRYVDLGRFYDLAAAKSSAEEVKARTHAYKAAYVRAYHNLKAARQVELDAVASVAKSFDSEGASGQREPARKDRPPLPGQHYPQGLYLALRQRGYPLPQGL